jgi:hypothetical protein
VHQILCILTNKQLRPLYFHCSVGRDRTSLIATLYELDYFGLPAEDAREEMKRFGFKDDWTLHGLKAYLRNHLSSPLKIGKDACGPISIPILKEETRTSASPRYEVKGLFCFTRSRFASAP